MWDKKKSLQWVSHIKLWIEFQTEFTLSSHSIKPHYRAKSQYWVPVLVVIRRRAGGVFQPYISALWAWKLPWQGKCSSIFTASRAEGLASQVTPTPIFFSSFPSLLFVLYFAHPPSLSRWNDRWNGQKMRAGAGDDVSWLVTSYLI